MNALLTNVALDELRDRIITDFSHAWELNDRAHRIEHFMEVEKTGHHINETLCLGYDPKWIMLVAFFHDLFAWSRNNHHLMSSEWVLSTDYKIIADLEPEARVMVAIGCREHRASNQEPFSCKFAELMSSADRGFPDTSLQGMVQRAIQFRMARGFSMDEARKGAIAHLKEKFGSDGYARYPQMYQEVFCKELEQQRAKVDVL